MSDSPVIRSALFVPGNRPDRIDKAMGTDADAIIIDLEDAVPLSKKEETRAIVREKVEQHREKTVFVRINALWPGLVDRALRAQNAIAGTFVERRIKGKELS